MLIGRDTKRHNQLWDAVPVFADKAEEKLADVFRFIGGVFGARFIDPDTPRRGACPTHKIHPHFAVPCAGDAGYIDEFCPQGRCGEHQAVRPPSPGARRALFVVSCSQSTYVRPAQRFPSLADLRHALPAYPPTRTGHAGATHTVRRRPPPTAPFAVPAPLHGDSRPPSSAPAPVVPFSLSSPPIPSPAHPSRSLSVLPPTRIRPSSPLERRFAPSMHSPPSTPRGAFVVPARSRRSRVGLIHPHRCRSPHHPPLHSISIIVHPAFPVRARSPSVWHSDLVSCVHVRPAPAYAPHCLPVHPRARPTAVHVHAVAQSSPRQRPPSAAPFAVPAPLDVGVARRTVVLLRLNPRIALPRDAAAYRTHSAHPPMAPASAHPSLSALPLSCACRPSSSP
ncbi:hypothetical protein HYPSUDRAFT_219112 [Hypholoma sublateritium FD-334 SS-4]|uniref:Uncharacterized protein n=1 Tax=Hypholoma sublateritium (strain FD-334 SS-4) TaxID=945553 RepID=A0A0D2NK43_HYPSF|nr:hypothetical protein HYPSUDRAFT_219112 [Hypholoma sublateritium FD-334 SS-4]